MRWLEVSVVTGEEAAEAVGAILLDLGRGYVEEHADGDVRLTAYVPSGAVGRASAVRGRVRALRAFGLDPSPARVTVRTIPATDWAEAWKKHFRPFRVGRFLVCPPWQRAQPAPGEVPLVLDPGMAFGTGLHGSTRLCLQALAECVRGGETVFDVGTGSGILAIAAARLGAGRVVAIDNDPLACRIAAANARANGVAERVTVRAGDLLRGVRVRADLILMNIVAPAIVRAAPQVVRRLRAGGRFVASGIVASSLTPVLSAVSRAGLSVDRELAEGEWRCVVCSAQSPDRLATTVR
ncbi:MAG: 50S ribosomal protein L11 methyltransferase [Armatimonadota bacterium]|nr:50S ribosomal protein L11 methyltransferase [Armatimonadota bacterium]